MTPAQASAAETAVVRAGLAATDAEQRRRFLTVWGRLPAKLADAQSAAVLSKVRNELAQTGRTSDVERWVQATNAFLRSRPESEHIAFVIDVLKYPTVAGKSGDRLLAGLRERFTDAPAQGANLREFIAWVTTRFPTLAAKLSEPPVRPPPDWAIAFDAHSLSIVVPGAAQYEAQRSGALQTRDPGSCLALVFACRGTWVPDWLPRIKSGASGMTIERDGNSQMR